MKESLVTEMIHTILSAVDPYEKTKEALKGIEVKGRLFMISVGKSSVKMAKAVTEKFKIEEGIVATYEEIEKAKEKGVTFIRAGHPLPNERSVEAAEKAIELLSKTTKDDTLFVMISGGGSALFESPLVSLSTLRSLTDTLMKRGADINELNATRKAFSKVKGGRLLSYTPAKIHSFVMSDVIGDKLSLIASGLTCFESPAVTKKAAEKVLKKYGVDLVVPDFPDFVPNSRVKHTIVASNKDACQAVVELAKKKGYNSYYLGSSVQGEAREIAKTLAGIYVDCHDEKNDFLPHTVIVSGGEPTVTVRGNGKGGRNQEMSLSILKYISSKDITFFSFATDGVDGNSKSAGAFVDGSTLRKSEEMGIEYLDFLENNDSNTFFDRISQLINTGPTGTNVMDVQVAIIK